MANSRLILLKDPRICRMVPFWLRGLDRARIVPRIVIAIRNPLESAMSLLDRDDIPVREGLLLWLRHVLDAERFTRGRDRCFVPYAELLNDWQAVADKLSRTLNVAWPTAPSAASSEIDRFLSREHRHHQSSYRDLEIRPDVFDWVLATYDAVAKLSASRESETEIFERLDDIGREFDRASRIFGMLVLQKNAQIDEYSRQLDDRSRQAVEIEGRLKRAEQELTDATAASARLRDEAREAMHRLQGEGSAALERVAKLAARAKTIEVALAQRTEEAERHRADLAPSPVTHAVGFGFFAWALAGLAAAPCRAAGPRPSEQVRPKGDRCQAGVACLCLRRPFEGLLGNSQAVRQRDFVPPSHVRILAPQPAFWINV